MDWSYFQIFWDISGVVTLAVKDPPANAGDVRTMDTVPGSGRSSGVGNGNSLQYSGLENCMDREAWQSTAHGVTKSQRYLKQLSSSSNSRHQCYFINI